MTRNSLKFLRSRASKGVALIYFACVVGVLLGFLMLIINTGVLVYQKIRLQSAADLAAYAGASVQASYLGNGSSGEDSIRGINFQILSRYAKLTQQLEELNRTPIPWPGLVPFEIPGPAGMAVCMAACVAANVANAQLRVNAFKSAARDLEQLRLKAARILVQLPKAAQRAAEETIRLNIPELAVESSGIAALVSQTTNKADEIIKNSSSDGFSVKKKNAVLSFESIKGMYLANVVASVPHSFVYYGPMCSWMRMTTTTPPIPTAWYCTVNGMGVGGGPMNYAMAAASFGRSFAPAALSGNVGTIDRIADSKANAIRLHFVQNANRPDPFFVSAVEWNPENGSFMNMENSLGATGSLFPKQTRLVAVAAAEPFGGSLFGSEQPTFGARLQSIRKLLLDPRMKAVKADYPGLMDYMQSLSPMDSQGRATEKSDEVIRRFLH